MFCQDEDEFPDLANGEGVVQHSTKPESNPTQTHMQPKLPKNLVREGAFKSERSLNDLCVMLWWSAEQNIKGVYRLLSGDFIREHLVPIIKYF